MCYNFTEEDQTLKHDGIQLTIFVSVIAVFGCISGQRKPGLLIERKVERSLSILSLSSIDHKLAWANSLLLDVVPVVQGMHPKEILCHGDLVAKSSLRQLRLSGNSLISSSTSIRRRRLSRVTKSSAYEQARTSVCLQLTVTLTCLITCKI